MNLPELGEFGFIDRIRARAASDRDAVLGIGDDCAASRLPEGELLLTSTDMLLEGMHFRLDWTRPYDLGRKSVAVNLSDLAAMGGTPRHIFLSLAFASSTDLATLDRILEGILDEAAEHGVSLLGGDTCRSPGPLVLNLCVQGSVPEKQMLRRDGAKAGQDIYVSGTLGDSALALRLRQQGQAPGDFLARRHDRPSPRVRLGRELAKRGLATAMIDLSDGLLSDLGHILKASGLGARIEGASLPLSAEFSRQLQEDGSLLDLAFAGGEDYELLFTATAARRAAVAALSRDLDLPLTRVGRTREGSNLLVLDAAGKPWEKPGRGFDHFSAIPE